jgi:hypothetical protein
MVITFNDFINFCTRYEKNQEAFSENVRLCVKTSQERVYDPAPVEDRHYITFEPYDNEVHGPIRDAVFKIKVCLFHPLISSSRINCELCTVDGNTELLLCKF